LISHGVPFLFFSRIARIKGLSDYVPSQTSCLNGPAVKPHEYSVRGINDQTSENHEKVWSPFLTRKIEEYNHVQNAINCHEAITERTPENKH
jgi:hypothetical protein